LKDLLKNTGIIGTAQIAIIIISILKNKYLAVTIGPQGYGTFSLLQSFFQMANIITGAGIGTACVKYIAEYNAKKDTDSIQQIFDFSISLVFLLSCIATLIFFIFFPFFKRHFLTQDIHFIYYALFAASYTGIMLSSIFTYLLRGLMQIKNMAKINIINSIFTLLSIIVLVHFYKLTGFFINIFISSVFILFLYYFFCKKSIKIRLKFPDFKNILSRKLLKFGSVDIFLGAVNFIGVYLQRLIVVNYLSISSLGLFSAADSLTRYLLFFNDSAQYYTFPKLSENTNSETKNKILNDYFRFSISIGIIFSLGLILFGTLIVRLFLSKSFDSINNILYIFVLAQFLAGIQYGFQWTITGMAKLKILSVVVIVSYILIVIIPFFLIKSLGLVSLGIGSICATLQYSIISSLYLKIKFQINISILNLIYGFLGIGMILISSQLIYISIFYKLLIYISLISFVFLRLKKTEWQFILKKIKLISK